MNEQETDKRREQLQDQAMAKMAGIMVTLKDCADSPADMVILMETIAGNLMANAAYRVTAIHRHLKRSEPELDMVLDGLLTNMVSSIAAGRATAENPDIRGGVLLVDAEGKTVMEIPSAGKDV